MTYYRQPVVARPAVLRPAYPPPPQPFYYAWGTYPGAVVGLSPPPQPQPPPPPGPSPVQQLGAYIRAGFKDLTLPFIVTGVAIGIASGLGGVIGTALGTYFVDRARRTRLAAARRRP